MTKAISEAIIMRNPMWRKFAQHPVDGYIDWSKFNDVNWVDE